MNALLTGVALAALALPSQALAANLFVSGKGADAAGCGPAAKPCRTFQYAHDLAPADSQIAVLDSGDYGPLVIRKSISIVNDGAGVAGVTYTGAGAAITIRAGVADKVVLRGLTLNGEEKGERGLDLASGGALDITNCAFNNFMFTGAALVPVGRGVTQINVVKSEFSSNRTGLVAAPPPPGSAMRLAINDSQFNMNDFDGIFIAEGAPGSSVVVTGGRIFGNNTGILSGGMPTGATLTLSGVTISGNSNGIVQGPGRLTLRGSTISENGIDISTVKLPSVTVTSTGDNTMFPTVQNSPTFVRTPLK